MKDYYKILGVKTSSTYDEIKLAYRKKARKYHPDVSLIKGSDDKIRDINEAWEVLKNKSNRAEYNEILLQEQGESSANDFFHRIFGNDSIVPDDDTEDRAFKYQEIEDVIGINTEQKWNNDLESIEKTIYITIEEAYMGKIHEFEYEQTMKRPGGLSIAKQKTVKVKIPKQTLAGCSLLMKNHGVINFDGRTGNLKITVQFLAHPFYEMQANHICLLVPVTASQIVLGCSLKVPTLNGMTSIKIPPSSQPRNKLRLRGLGFKGGDQYLKFNIVVPEKITSQEKIAYEKLAHYSQFIPKMPWQGL